MASERTLEAEIALIRVELRVSAGRIAILEERASITEEEAAKERERNNDLAARLDALTDKL